jgi:hypothetical protein
MLETGEIERFASLGNYASTVGVWEVRRSATANVKEAAIAKTATSIWPGRLWRPPTLRFGLIRRSKASIRKEIQEPCDRGHQSSGAQALPGFYYIIKDQVPFDITKAFA